MVVFAQELSLMFVKFCIVLLTKDCFIPHILEYFNMTVFIFKKSTPKYIVIFVDFISK